MDTRSGVFNVYSWDKLIHTLLLFKKTMSKSSKQAEWNRHRLGEIHGEMGYIQGIMDNPNATIAERNDVAHRIVGAACYSRKIFLRKGEPDGEQGRVLEAHTGITLDDGTWVDLPHVTFKVETGEATMRHRLEEIRLKTEPWWFSITEHKPPNK